MNEAKTTAYIDIVVLCPKCLCALRRYLTPYDTIYLKCHCSPKIYEQPKIELKELEVM